MSRTAAPLAGRRILVVEDEYLIAMEVEGWLQTAGSEVLGPVPSVDQALDLIEGHPPEAAVLDINLGDGVRVYPVADKLGELGIPYLFATGDATVSSADGYRERPRLDKPYSEAQLLHALVDLIAAASISP